MKKTLALVLALTLCLSLAACGQQERYPEIADLLDAGDYEGAVKEIYELYQAANSNNPDNSDDPDDPTEPTVDRDTKSQYQGIVNAANNWNNRIANGDRYEWFSAYYWVYETDENGNTNSDSVNFQGIEALEWVYNTALELGDFEKSAQIASRFTLLENKLLTLKYTHTDALGNLVEDSELCYEYAADGSLSYQSTDYIAPKGMYETSGTPEETLNDAGQVTTITYKSSDGKVNSIITFTYNEDGTVATEEYKDSDGDTCLITYTYDENGRKVQATGVPYQTHVGTDTMTVTYHYDDAGRLVHEAGVRDEDSESTWVYEKHREYAYDDAGNLTSVSHYSMSYWRGEPQYKNSQKLWEYQYDSNGQLTQSTYSYLGDYDYENDTTNGGNDYVVIGTPTYGTFYVYTPGEEIQYNN